MNKLVRIVAGEEVRFIRCDNIQQVAHVILLLLVSVWPDISTEDPLYDSFREEVKDILSDALKESLSVEDWHDLATDGSALLEEMAYNEVTWWDLHTVEDFEEPWDAMMDKVRLTLLAVS